MAKLKAIILDDIENDINLLEQELKAFPVTIEKRYTDPRKFIFEEPKLKYDVLFADMNMPGLLGSEVIAKIKKPVILITGEGREYAEQIIDIGVENKNFVCVLNKPINEKRIAHAFDKLQEKIQKSFLIVNTPEGKTVVNINEIELISSQDLDRNNDSQGEAKIIYLKGKMPVYVNSLNLDTVFLHLNKKIFLKANRYDIINIACAKTFKHDNIEIEYSSNKATLKRTSRTLGKDGREQYEEMLR